MIQFVGVKKMADQHYSFNRFPLWMYLMILGLLFVVLAGCGPSPAAENGTESELPVSESSEETSETSESEPVAEETSELTEVTLVTNWFAEPEHGGHYAALAKGFYEEAGLDVTIEPGGPQVSATQIVASGQAQFGMGQADEVLIARDEGIPLVAIASAFQKSPQGLLYHQGQDIEDFSDLDGRTVYIAPGSAYWEYIQSAYELEHVNELAYTGQLVNFIEDEESITQCYITSEPYSLEQQGIETDYLLIADSGYSPYANLLFTTEQYIEEHPDIVEAFVKASMQGWEYYRDHADEINPVIHEANPDYPLDAMAYAAEAQEELIFGEDAEEYGVGYMSEERWVTLRDQMLEMGLLKEAADVNEAFTMAFWE